MFLRHTQRKKDGKLHRYDADSGLALGVTYEFQPFGRARGPKTIR